MTHYAIQGEADDISRKLKLVAKIQVNQKINVKQALSLQDKKAWGGRFWRTWNGTWGGWSDGEGRNATYEFIKELIDRAHKLLLNLRHSNSDLDNTLYRKITGELIKIETGLRNLIKTYNRDLDYVSKIETLIENNLMVKVNELCDYKSFNLGKLRAEVLDEETSSDAESLAVETGSSLGNNASDVSMEDEDEDDESTEPTRTSPPLPVAPQDLMDNDDPTDPAEECPPLEEVTWSDIAQAPPPPPKPVAVAPKEDVTIIDVADSFSSDSSDSRTRKKPTKSKQNDAELMDLLNKINLNKPVPAPASNSNSKNSRKNRRNQSNANNAIKDDNPFRHLKHNYMYDIECGLQPPGRLPRKKKQI